jgi:hypothetical protein
MKGAGEGMTGNRTSRRTHNRPSWTMKNTAPNNQTSVSRRTHRAPPGIGVKAKPLRGRPAVEP